MNKQISRRESLVGLGCAAAVYISSRAPCNGASSTQISGIPVDLAIHVVSDTILRITLLPSATRDTTLKNLNDDQVLAPTLPPLTESPGTLTWGARKITASTSPLAIRIEDARSRVIQSLHIDEQGNIKFKSSMGPVYGLGEGGAQFDRRGQVYSMRNGQFPPLLATIGARLPIPWLASADGWAIFFHKPSGLINLTEDEYAFEQPATAVDDVVPLDLFLAVSRDPAEIMKAYAQITGFPHLPPLWALGYQQSHRTLASREEIVDEAKRFRKEELPCDTMIYLGTGFCPSGWNTGHGSFTFNERAFPDPKEMIQDLHSEHFHLVLHLTKPPEHLHGRVTDTGLALQDISDAAYYWRRHLDVFNLGIDGWWPDEGDSLSLEARLTRNRMYWEGPIKERPNERPFALHRNGYAGMQRYAWLWSGDVDCTWETLRQQIPVGLNAGLTGLPYWGTDTGGFVPTKELTGELFVRWFQFSAFCPLFRSHGRAWKLRLPWGWNTGESGPVEVDTARMPDSSELHNAQVEPICKTYLNLRYQLLPYTYTIVREAHDTGMPPMRALWLHYPEDPKAAAIGDEYLWGRDILVAPVTERGATARQVYLPQGIWYDFWTGVRVEGNTTITRQVDLATMPVYIRAGAVVPFGPVKQYAAQESNEPITLRVYPGESGASFLYVDDGISFAYEHNDYLTLRMNWDEARRRLILDQAAGRKKLLRDIKAELMPEVSAKRVSLEQTPAVIQF